MNRLNPTFASVRRALSIMTTGLAIAAALSACGTTDTTGTGGTSDAISDVLADTGAGTDATSSDAADVAKDVPKDVKKADIQVAADPDNTPETATAIDLSPASTPTQPASDTLDPTGDVDYFSFAGTKGQVVYFRVAAQTLSNVNKPYDPDTVDVIMTVLGPDKQQIAFNDDPLGGGSNDSEIVTVLPSDGTYYVRVEECNTWLAAHPQAGNVGCGTPDKSNTDYTLSVLSLTDGAGTLHAEKETGDTEKEATELPYAKFTDGKYYATFLMGTFKGIVDVDVYHFTVPADYPVTDPTARGSINLKMFPGTTNGDGSSAPMGTAWLASDAAPTAMLAQIDLAKSNALEPPIKFGKGYFFFTVRASGAFTDREFYFFNFYAGEGNPVETKESANDVATGAETAKSGQTVGGGQAGFIEGDIINGAKDVDWWVWNVPAGSGGGQLFAVCGSQSVGSGTRSFKIELFSDAGKTPITSGSQVEDVTKGIYIDKLVAPADGGTVYIKVTAGSQAADVSSSFYRCGVGITAP